MGQFTVYRENHSDHTSVSNTFIDNYMKDANDAQIKVYLYLLRILSSGGICSISGLADMFNYTEKDIRRALKYWEKVGLIILDTDDENNVTGVRLVDEHNKVTSPTEEAVKAKESEEPMFKKPAYTAKDVMEFESKDSSAETVCVVENLLNRPLSPNEIKSLIFFTDELGFSIELIDYLFEYCISRDKKSFSYIEKVAINWAESGITTPRQAAETSGRYNKNVYEVMKYLGKSTTPTKSEIGYVTKWTDDMGFPMDIIYEACQKTVEATDSHRFKYADRILTAWHENNVRSKNDIDTLDRMHEEEKIKKTPSRTPNTVVPQHKQFTQRKYDFDELEKELLSNRI